MLQSKASVVRSFRHDVYAALSHGDEVMTRGNRWASEDCYKALKELVAEIDSTNGGRWFKRDCNPELMDRVENALSYYDWHGIGGEDNGTKTHGHIENK